NKGKNDITAPKLRNARKITTTGRAIRCSDSRKAVEAWAGLASRETGEGCGDAVGHAPASSAQTAIPAAAKHSMGNPRALAIDTPPAGPTAIATLFARVM